MTRERENERLKLINEMDGMICDINEKEIASHIEDGTLKNFCETWRVNMRYYFSLLMKEYLKETAKELNITEHEMQETVKNLFEVIHEQRKH